MVYLQGEKGVNIYQLVKLSRDPDLDDEKSAINTARQMFFQLSTRYRRIRPHLFDDKKPVR